MTKTIEELLVEFDECFNNEILETNHPSNWDKEDLKILNFKIKQVVKQSYKAGAEMMSERLISSDLRHITDTKGELNSGDSVWDREVNEVQKDINAQNHLKKIQRQISKEVLESL